MEILIRLAGVQLGPYSEAQVRQHIADGLLSLTDLAKVDGSEEWASLAETLAKVTRESRNLPKIELAAATVALPTNRRSTNTGTAPLPSRTTVPISKPAAETKPSPAPQPNPNPDPEPAKRAPSTPPGVSHLPTRNSEEDEGPDMQPVPQPSAPPQDKKTMLLGPTAPDATLNVAQAASTTVTTSPLVGTQQKKTSRAALVKSLNKTAPLPSGTATTPWRPPSATPDSAPPEAPTTILPKQTAPELKNESSLIRSLQAKTVPMRNKPGQASSPATHAPVTTTPMPTRPVSKPVQHPPGSVEQSMDKMVLPDSGPIRPPTPLSKEDREKLAKKKDEGPDEEDDGTPRTRHRRSIRILPILIFLTAILAIAIPYYVWSPYHSAMLLRTTLNSGDPGDLGAMIDFPSVRESLKEQVQKQLGAAGDAASAKALSILNESIDHYVTPEGISALVTKSENSTDDDPDNVISSKVAYKLLSALKAEPTKNQGLASLGDFVMDRDVALLHLRNQILGWKLKQVDLVPKELAAAAGGSTSPLLQPVVDTYLARGDAKARKTDWNGAIAEYTQVLSIDPHSSVAYNARGLAKQAQSDIEGAIKDFTQTLTIDPQNAAAYNDRGGAKFAKGNADAAIVDFTQAIKLDPGLAAAYDSRGNAKASKDDLEGAIADYTQAIVIDPNRAQPYSDRGFARQANGNAEGAIADYTAALALDPKAATTYYNRGLARQAQGNLEAAITDFDRALAFDPTIAYAYYFRGNAKSANHDPDGAIADYTHALSLNPKIAQAYNNRGQVRQSRGDLDGAAADYSSALSVDTKLVPAYLDRAQIKAQKNDLDGAIADSSHAFDLDPKNGAALYIRGFAKLAKGNLDGAQADLKQFCNLESRDHDADRARIYLWLIAKAQGAKAGGDPDQDLSQALETSWNSNPDDLVSKTASFLLGRTNEADYRAAASSLDAKTDQIQHCQTWYFAGIKRLLTGDRAGAIAAFKMCIATGQTTATEYMLATSELNALQPTAPPPPAAAATPAPNP